MKKKTAAIIGLSIFGLGASAAVNKNFTADEVVHSVNYLEEHQEADYSLRYTAPAELSKIDQIRASIIAQSVFVKALFLLPVWALGAIPAALLTALTSSGILSILENIILQAAILFGLFCGAFKIVFPEKKITELFKKKNFKWIVFGSLAVSVTNFVLAEVWDSWNIWRLVLMIVVGFGVLALLWYRICGKREKVYAKPTEQENILQLTF